MSEGDEGGKEHQRKRDEDEATRRRAKGSERAKRERLSAGAGVTNGVRGVVELECNEQRDGGMAWRVGVERNK